MKWNKKDVEFSMEYLKKILELGSTVYTVLVHVSKSGMTRHIMCLAVVDGDDGPEIVNISSHVAKVLGYSLDQSKNAVVVRGVGMDMGFHLVYNLSYELLGNGYFLEHKWL